VPEALATPRPAPALTRPLLRGATIVAVGAALPEHVVTTSEIAERLGVTDRWIESRTGVRERRLAMPGERLADLAARAGRDAVERAGVDAESVDLVIVATCTAEQPVPPTSPLVAGLVGASRAGTLDLNAACTGFITALDVACAQVESGRAERALVIGADLMSRIVDPDDRRTAALFGDGAGAVIVDPTTVAAGIGPTVMGSDSTGAWYLHATHEPASLVMDGHETFKAAVARLAEVTLDALAAADLTAGDIDLFVYHQANARILTAAGERLALAPGRVVNVIGTLGNTSSASIPLALAAAERDGTLKPGARLLLGACGAGFTWGATTLTWGSDDA
jgi:3-oxoacyl-[acyl-carrier-protein] synthase-3